MKKGGEYIGQGADTCVYDPPLQCVGRPEYPSHKYVSRVMPFPGESDIQYGIKAIIRNYETIHPGKVSKHFNMMIDACSIFTVKETDVANSKSGKKCTHHPSLQQPGTVDSGYENVITPKQAETILTKNSEGETVLSRSATDTAKGLYGLMCALIYCRGDFIHNDAHGKNIAWMPEGHIALFDWGRSMVYNEDDLEDRINRIERRAVYYSGFTQFRNIVTAIGFTSEPARLAKVWDLMAILSLMEDYEVLPSDIVESTTDTLFELIRDKDPTEFEILANINRMYKKAGLSVAGIPLVPTVNVQHRAIPAPIPLRPTAPVAFPFGVSTISAESSVSGGVKQSTKFCRCIKAVRKTIKARPGSTKESGAIAVCNVSILGKKGRTLKKFRCGKKPYLKTQKKLK